MEIHHIPKFPVTVVKDNLMDSLSYSVISHTSNYQSELTKVLTALGFPSLSDIDGQQKNGTNRLSRNAGKIS